jgi:hypothetical protein
MQASFRQRGFTVTILEGKGSSVKTPLGRNDIIAFASIYQRQPIVAGKCAIIHAVNIGVGILNGHAIKIKFGSIKCKLLFGSGVAQLRF